MLERLETIREFNTRNFKVQVDAYQDWDVDLSWDDTGEVREKLESGEFQSFGVVVKVFHKPTGLELGEDSLWGCIYENPAKFMDHRLCGIANKEYAKQGETGRCGSYFSDMISESITAARKTVAQMNGIKLRAA